MEGAEGALKLPPFLRRKAEVRAQAPYTDAVVTAIQQAASGKTTANPAATAALEAASGLVGRSFASAEVTGGGMVAEPLTPAVLALTGRELLRRGECVYLIRVAERVELLPCAGWDITGPDDETLWTYRVDTFGPSGGRTRTVTSASVLHFRYAFDPATPWQGLGPLQWARISGRLLAEAESALADESAGPRGHLIPVPAVGSDETDDDGNDTSPLDDLRKDVSGLRGGAALVETTAGDGYGTGNAPRRDWQPNRLGAEPPQSLVSLRSDAAQAVLAACGVPVELVQGGEGTGAREAYRRFLHATLNPLAALVQAELRAKLAPDVSLSFDSLFASDLAGRARAFGSLVKGGMEPERAAALSGLVAASDD